MAYHLTVEPDGRRFRVVTALSRVVLGPAALDAIGAEPDKLEGLAKREAEAAAEKIDPLLAKALRSPANKGRK
jgi:hypothetical protein